MRSAPLRDGSVFLEALRRLRDGASFDEIVKAVTPLPLTIIEDLVMDTRFLVAELRYEQCSAMRKGFVVVLGKYEMRWDMFRDCPLIRIRNGTPLPWQRFNGKVVVRVSAGRRPC